MRPSRHFLDEECAFLSAIYEAPDGRNDSYTLSQLLVPNAKPGTPAATKAFAETLKLTEQFIARDLVRGERQTGADGVFFRKLKLTPKGQRAAIQARAQVERTKQALDEALVEHEKVVKEMDRYAATDPPV